MIDQDVVREFVFSNFSNVKESQQGSHWLLRCPFCGDSKKRLKLKRFHIDWSAGNPWFKCYNGGCVPGKGNFYTLYSHVKGVTYQEAREQLKNRYNPKEIVKRFSEPKFDFSAGEQKLTRLDPNIFLPDFVTETEHTTSLYLQNLQRCIGKFREERRIPENINLYAGFNGQFRNRIIIPIFNSSNELIYFQARGITDAIQPKYLNPEVDKKDIIVNEHLINKGKYIIITEGLLDAYSCGNQGIPILGASLEDSFLRKIFSKSSVGAILALDNDETGIKVKQEIMKHSSFKERLRYFSFPQEYQTIKDLGEFISETKMDVDSIYDFVYKNSKSYLQELTSSGGSK